MLLLDRLYDLSPENGRITIGGVDIADMKREHLRKNIGIVLQEPFLFSRTLKENLSITDEKLTLTDIREAARAACLDDTIQGFAKGYETFVGERGVTLSGGQKQRAAIARMLNDRGIPNPTEYKRLKGLRYKQPTAKNSTLWKYFAISDMLVNEIYIGNMVQGKYGSISYKTKQNKPRPKSQWYIVEGTHEPIIDRELWDRVQKMIKERAKPFDVGTIGLFARKARCANCGYVMRSSKNRGKHYLQCSNRHVAKDACIGSFISVDKLEQLVIDELNRLSREYLDKDDLERKIELCNNLQAQKDSILKNIASYEKRAQELSKGIRELYMDKVKGLISGADYTEMSKDFIADRDRLEKLISDGRKQIEEIDVKIEVGDNRREIIERYTNLKHLTREMVEILIDYISVGKRMPKTKDVPITIHWSF